MSQPTLKTRIRTYFPTPFAILTMIILVFSVTRILMGGGWGWLGPILPTLAFSIYMMWLVRRSPARTRANMPIVIGLSLLGFALSFVAGGAAPWLAGIGLLGNALYTFWYSKFGREPSALLVVGHKLPPLMLEDDTGERVNLEEDKAHKKIYLFYRGNWCPLCVGQIREVAALYRELDERGAQVMFVSSQSHENSRELATRFDVPFRFLVDPQNQTARLLGIAHEQGVPFGVNGYEPDTVMPTVIITDESGTILFTDQTDNYRVRPEPATFLRVLDEQALSLQTEVA